MELDPHAQAKESIREIFQDLTRKPLQTVEDLEDLIRTCEEYRSRLAVRRRGRESDDLPRR